MKNSVALALLLSGISATMPAAARAQACVGSPVSARGVTFGPSYGLLHAAQADRTVYGASTSLNPGGPLGVDVRYGYTRWVRLGQQGAHVRPSLELLRGRASLCAVAGVGFERVAEDGALLYTTDGVATPYNGRVTNTDWVMPVGLAAGTTRPLARGTSLTVYAMPQALFVHHRQRLAIVNNGPSEVFTSDLRKAAIEGGVRLRVGRLAGGLSYLNSGWDDMRDLWSFNLQLVAGR